MSRFCSRPLPAATTTSRGCPAAGPLPAMGSRGWPLACPATAPSSPAAGPLPTTAPWQATTACCEPCAPVAAAAALRASLLNDTELKCLSMALIREREEAGGCFAVVVAPLTALTLGGEE